MKPNKKSIGMICHGIAATSAIDKTGEKLDIDNADITDLEEGKGIINIEHISEEKGMGQEMIGRIIFAKKIYKEEDCDNELQLRLWNEYKLPSIYIIFRLWDGVGNPGAASFASAIRDAYVHGDKNIIGLSVEGSTLERKDNVLVRTVIRKVAATIKPANATCVSEVLYDPNAPEGFEPKGQKEVKDSLKDILDQMKKCENWSDDVITQPLQKKELDLVKKAAKTVFIKKILEAPTDGMALFSRIIAPKCEANASWFSYGNLNGAQWDMIARVQAAPLTVNFSPACLPWILKTGLVKNKFRKAYNDKNRLFEKETLGIPTYINGLSRPIYGALDLSWNESNTLDGGAPMFGSAYVTLKPEVKMRATFCHADSLHVKPNEFMLNKDLDKVALKYVADPNKDNFIESQIYGPVLFSRDVASLCVSASQPEVVETAVLLGQIYGVLVVGYDENDNRVVIHDPSVRQDIIPGGLADNKQPSDFDQAALQQGTQVESEHTSNPNIATEISMDHLTEDPQYYDKLKQLEKTLTAGGTNAAPSSLVGGSALQKEDVGKQVESVGSRAKKKFKRVLWKAFCESTKERSKENFQGFMKANMPGISEDYLDYFDDASEDFDLKQKQLKKAIIDLEFMTVELQKAVHQFEDDEGFDQEPEHAAPIMFNNKQVNPGKALVGGNLHYLMDETPDHFIAAPHNAPDFSEGNLVRLPKQGMGKDFHFVSPIVKVGDKHKLDAGINGVFPFNISKDQHDLIHGLEVDKEVESPQHAREGINSGVSRWSEHPAHGKVYLKGTTDRGGDFEDTHREMAYHNIAKNFFGLGHMTPTTAAYQHPSNGRLNIVQKGVEGARHADRNSAKDKAAFDKIMKSGDLDKAVFMDYVMGNVDRHMGNFLIDHNDQLHLIDHGLSFGNHNMNEMRRPGRTGLSGPGTHFADWDMKPLHPEFAKWLSGLDEGALKRQLDFNKVPRQSQGPVLERFRTLKNEVAKYGKSAMLPAFNSAAMAAMDESTRKTNINKG